MKNKVLRISSAALLSIALGTTFAPSFAWADTASALNAVNSATDDATMQAALQNDASALGLDLTQYNTMSSDAKTGVADVVLTDMPSGGYTSTADLQSIFSNEVTASVSTASLTPAQIVTNMGPGWNLGNTLEPPGGEGTWNNPPVTQKVFDDVKAAGFKSVRIPLSFMNYTGSGPNYTVDATWLNRIQQVVDMALKDNLYVDVDMHGDAWSWATTASTTAQFNSNMAKVDAIWTQLANRLKDDDRRVIMEVLNEPGWNGTSDGLTGVQEDEQWNTNVVNTIRATGGPNTSRIVMLDPIGDNPQQLASDAQYYIGEEKSDGNIIATMHYYVPWLFVANQGQVTWGTASDKQSMQNDLQSVYAALVQQGVPVVIGEYGGIVQNDRYSVLYYYDYLNKLAKSYGIATMLWDSGWKSGLDRTSNTWFFPDEVRIIVNEWYGIQNSFVNPLDLYVPAGTTGDQTLSLELNGNTLTSITNGRYTLQEGVDYTFDAANSTVTLKQAYLQKILVSGEMGTNADLMFNFSAGLNQDVKVIQYQDPSANFSALSQLQAKGMDATVLSGSTSGSEPTLTIEPPSGGYPWDDSQDVYIPWNYNGTDLQVLAPADPTITPAWPGGPKNPEISWSTAIAKYGDYDVDANDIILRPSFLNSLKAGHTYTLTLTFAPNITKEVVLKVTSPDLQTALSNANTALANATAAETAYVKAGGSKTDSVYTAVTAAVGTVNADLTADPLDASTIAQDTTVLGNAVTALNKATAAEDQTPPSTLSSVYGKQGSNGWYVSPVQLTLSATDNSSGVAATYYSTDGGSTWQTYSIPVSFSADGKYNVEYYSVDNAGNKEAAQSVSFNIDQTPPTISVTSPTSGSYLDDQSLAMAYTVSDSLSGVDTASSAGTLDGQPITNGNAIALYTLSLGSHTLTVNAEDNAGNKATKTVTFQVSTSVDSLKKLVSLFTNNGSIDNGGISNALTAKLDSGNLQAFVNQVKAQSGKHISASVSKYLLRDANYLLGQ